MEKVDLAYKLTSDIVKKYDLKELETKYNAYGGKLISLIFNEISETISFTDEFAGPIILNNVSNAND